MVTFRPDVGYSEALRKERWQKDVVGYTGWIGSAIGISAAGVFAVAMAKKWLERR